jgi:hypothetical protein
MEMNRRTGLSLGGVALMVGAGLALYAVYSFKRQMDWDEVQTAAIRVDSGLRHETLIALRSRVADLDAALTHYITNSSRRQNEKRVASIKQAIESLEWAIQHENASERSATWDGDEGFSYFERRPYLFARPTCAESTGKLLLGTSDLAHASLMYVQSALMTPEQQPPVRTLDLDSLRAACDAKHEALKNQEVTAEVERQKANERATIEQEAQEEARLRARQEQQDEQRKLEQERLNSLRTQCATFFNSSREALKTGAPLPPPACSEVLGWVRSLTYEYFDKDAMCHLRAKCTDDFFEHEHRDSCSWANTHSAEVATSSIRQLHLECWECINIDENLLVMAGDPAMKAILSDNCSQAVYAAKHPFLCDRIGSQPRKF